MIFFSDNKPISIRYSMTLYLSNEPVQSEGGSRLSALTGGRTGSGTFHHGIVQTTAKPPLGRLSPFLDTSVSEWKQQNIYRTLSLQAPAQQEDISIYKTMVISQPYSGDTTHLHPYLTSQEAAVKLVLKAEHFNESPVIVTSTRDIMITPLSVCLLVCLLERLHKNYWTSCHETWCKDPERVREESTDFWSRPKGDSRLVIFIFFKR